MDDLEIDLGLAYGPTQHGRYFHLHAHAVTGDEELGALARCGPSLLDHSARNCPGDGCTDAAQGGIHFRQALGAILHW